MLRTEEQLQEHYRLGVKVAGIGLGTVDYVADTITLDDRSAALFDLTANVEISRDKLHARIHSEDWLAIQDKVDQMIDHKSEPFFEATHRIVHTSGDIVWVNVRKQITFSTPFDGTGVVPVSGIFALIDVTEHKKDQERVQFLLDELNHRSKNMLTVVQSIARRTLATGDADNFSDRFSERLAGLARNYDAMVKGAWEYADLSDLIKSHLGGFFDAAGGRATLTGPEIKISPKEAQAIGLAFHELATNASKYGALSVPGGSVLIDWHVRPDHKLSITWTEVGGPAVQEPSRIGFGTRLIKDMAQASLGGTVDVEYRPEGLFWQLIFASEKLG